MTLDSSSPPDAAGERRLTWRRTTVDDHGIVSARVRPGHDVAVIDVSAGGVLVECMHRLLPGAPVEVQFVTPRARAVVRGRVLRCSVAHVRPAVVFYRGAIGFDRHLSWFLDDRIAGGGPAEAAHPGRPAWAAATRHAI